MEGTSLLFEHIKPRILTTMDNHFYIHFFVCVNFAVQPIPENIHSYGLGTSWWMLWKFMFTKITNMFAKNFYQEYGCLQIHCTIYFFLIQLVLLFLNWFYKQNEFQGHFIIICFLYHVSFCSCDNNFLNSILAYPNGRKAFSNNF